MLARLASVSIVAVLLASCTSVPSKGDDPPGRTATCAELVGFWRLVPLDDPTINKVNPWPLPFQWFAFYEDKHLVSMMTTEDSTYSREQLAAIFEPLREGAPTYRCEGPWLVVEYPQGQGAPEVWGKNIFTRRAGLNNPTPFERGEIVLTLSDRGGSEMMYFRRLRKVAAEK